MTFAAPNARGMFAYYETKQVPIQRLFTNLQQRLAAKTTDFQLTYQLARLHAMAYSTNLAEVQVRKEDDTHPVFAFAGYDKGVPERVVPALDPQVRQAAYQHLTNAILLYQRSIVLLRASTNVMEQRWMVVPTQIGLAWCLDQAGRKPEAINAYRRALRIAWRLEVTGDFDIKELLKDVWRDVSSMQNPVHAHNRGSLGPGVCYSQEIIAYLLKLLDPVKDASEIAELKKDQQTLATMPRAITPIIVPLESGADLAELVQTNAQVAFDLDGSGLARNWGWITPKAAWLVYDPERRGEITSGLQMFGNVTFWIFWRDGYDALRALDDNGDGVLSGAELNGLALWRDLNTNGRSEPGEVVPVEAFGITRISCASRAHDSGIPWNPAGVTFKDGSARPTYDWIAGSAPMMRGR